LAGKIRASSVAAALDVRVGDFLPALARFHHRAVIVDQQVDLTREIIAKQRGLRDVYRIMAGAGQPAIGAHHMVARGGAVIMEAQFGIGEGTCGARRLVRAFPAVDVAAKRLAQRGDRAAVDAVEFVDQGVAAFGGHPRSYDAPPVPAMAGRRAGRIRAVPACVPPS
jgi:hypothetical protein